MERTYTDADLRLFATRPEITAKQTIPTGPGQMGQTNANQILMAAVRKGLSGKTEQVGGFLNKTWQVTIKGQALHVATLVTVWENHVIKAIAEARGQK